MKLELTLKCSDCSGEYHKKRSVYPEDIGEDMMMLLREAEGDGWIVDYENEEAICEACESKRKSKLMKLPEKITWNFYLHSSKEGNEDQIYDLEKEFGISLPEEAKEVLMYALYEVKATLEINPRTGEYLVIRMEEV